MCFVGATVGVVDRSYALAITLNFGGLRHFDDADVAHGVGFILQYLVGAQGVAELEYSHFLNDTR